MEIIIYSPQGEKSTVTVQGQDLNIRQLRILIGKALSIHEWGKIAITDLKDADGNSLGAIYVDDNEEFTLTDLAINIQNTKKYKNFNFDRIFIYTALGKENEKNFFRPTKYNPLGYCPAEALKHYKKKAFFQEALQLTPTKKKFRDEFMLLNIPEHQIPQEFFCKIYEHIMNNPYLVIDIDTQDQRTFDLETWHKLSFCPYTSKDKSCFQIKPNLRLRSRIQEFLDTEYEKRALEFEKDNNYSYLCCWR